MYLRPSNASTKDIWHINNEGYRMGNSTGFKIQD